MKKLIILFAILVLYMFLYAAFGPAEHTTRATRQATSNRNEFAGSASVPPVEYRLAVINAGSYVPEDDITVVRFRYLLEVLERKTTSSKEQISDMTCAAVQRLRNVYGVEVKLLDYMEGVNASIPEGTKADYAAVSTIYMQFLK